MCWSHVDVRLRTELMADGSPQVGSSVASSCAPFDGCSGCSESWVWLVSM